MISGRYGQPIIHTPWDDAVILETVFVDVEFSQAKRPSVCKIEGKRLKVLFE